MTLLQPLVVHVIIEKQRQFVKLKYFISLLRDIHHYNQDIAGAFLVTVDIL